MLKDRQLIFGLIVGLITACLGVLVLQVNVIGWSLMAVGIAVAGMAIISHHAIAKVVLVSEEKTAAGSKYALLEQ